MVESELNKALVTRVSAALGRGDTEPLCERLAPDARWNIVGFRTVKGRQNIVEAVGMLLEAENFPLFTITNVVAEGECVVVESTGEAKRKTGEPYKAHYCDVYHVKEGRIYTFSTYVIETL